MTANPTIITRSVSTQRIRARIAAIESAHDEMRQRRTNGYRGPLTRSDAARRTARDSARIKSRTVR